jgi:hypothetical protein
MTRRFGLLFVAALCCCPIAQAAERQIADQGYVFAGGHYVAGPDGQYLSGQAYVEYQIPSRRAHSIPIVMIEGGGQSGSNFTGTPGRSSF